MPTSKLQMRSTGYGLCLLACCLCGTRDPVYAAEPLFTQQEAFFIPFSIDPGNGDRSRDSRVTLFVSGDGGRQWHAYQQQPLHVGRFSFRAGADGEFFFAIRNEDVTSLAAGSPAELIVIVDRQPPTVDLECDDPSERSVRVTWSVDDTSIGNPVVTFETRESATATWQPLQVDSTVSGSVAHREGMFLWNPANGSTAEIRAIAVDRAGNRAVVERRLMDSRPATPSATNNLPLAAAESWQPSQANSSNGQGVQTVLRGPDAVALNTALAPQVIRNDFMPQSPGATTPAENLASQPGQVLASRSRRFQLDYVIENGTPGGVHRVEIWCTDDRGQTWRHYGDDEDRRSPCDVEVRGDGEYGFRLLVQAREGVAPQPPRSGDPPEMIVRVDATPPVARLTSARFAHGNLPGEMTITWEASDAVLTDRPVALYFGESTNGPWRRIASDLPNTGQHAWQIDDRVPTQFHLRLEVCDRAGNIASDVLANPIRRDGFAPHGQIRGVQPVP